MGIKLNSIVNGLGFGLKVGAKLGLKCLLSPKLVMVLEQVAKIKQLSKDSTRVLDGKVDQYFKLVKTIIKKMDGMSPEDQRLFIAKFNEESELFFGMELAMRGQYVEISVVDNETGAKSIYRYNLIAKSIQVIS